MILGLLRDLGVAVVVGCLALIILMACQDWGKR